MHEREKEKQAEGGDEQREAGCQRDEIEGKQRRGKQREAEKDKAEIRREGKTETEKQKQRETEVEGHTDQERRSYKEEESNTVKQHYKPLLFSAVLGPGALEPSERRQ